MARKMTLMRAWQNAHANWADQSDNDEYSFARNAFSHFKGWASFAILPTAVAAVDPKELWIATAAAGVMAVIAAINLAGGYYEAKEAQKRINDTWHKRYGGGGPVTMF